MFKKILIANRGEIACRVMKTAKKMGIATVAVYSDADKDALHVEMADEAVNIGPAPSAESYLVMENILKAVKDTGAEAVHPGYGFLSENSVFAELLKKEGIAFIGPNVEAIQVMGDKIASKKFADKAKVNTVPGNLGVIKDTEEALKVAGEVGYPVMMKASAGGGGKGMRIAWSADDVAEGFQSAINEAVSSFGDDRIFIEKFIVEPRHIEIQVMADGTDAIYVGERECSIQRRNQKVIEEAPSPFLDEATRKKMGEQAVALAKAVNYQSAGTVEFIVDKDRNFYFLEMNTRLQVEHPVTELVTGLDLVALQIQVAQGQKLGLTQSDIALEGHAIEARLYAEDTSADFLPATGSIELWQADSSGNARIDHGIKTGGAVSPFYDPMLAKIITLGRTRDEAIQKLTSALKNSPIFGVTTNQKFLVDALANDVFARGEATTSFIEEQFSASNLQTPSLSCEEAIIASTLQFESSKQAAQSKAINVGPEHLNWVSAFPVTYTYRYHSEVEDVIVAITPIDARSYEVVIGDNEAASVDVLCIEDNHATLKLDGQNHTVHFHVPTDKEYQIYIYVDGLSRCLENKNAMLTQVEEKGGAGSIIAPMHGTLLELFVEAGQKVKSGDRLAILEAMKMQHEIVSDIDGSVDAVHFTAGTQIEADSLIIEIGTDC